MQSATSCARGLEPPPSLCGDNEVHKPLCRRGSIVMGVVRNGGAVSQVGFVPDGSHTMAPAQFTALLDGPDIDFARIRVPTLGGLTPARKIAALCELRGVRLKNDSPVAASESATQVPALSSSELGGGIVLGAPGATP